MTIKIESVINQWDSETDEVIIRFLNLLTLAEYAGNWSKHLTSPRSRNSIRSTCNGDGEAITFG